jgi:DNA-binding MarR family transcriptional regulator
MVEAERAHDARVDLGCLPRLLGYNLRRAHQSSWRHYVSTIGENKIRPGLFSLLVLARSNPGICQIELGSHLGIDKASMVALLDRLESAGLIERRRSTRDRRRQGIFLTAGGSAELETLLVDVRLLEKQMAGRYSKAELEQFIGFLQRMYD